MGFVDWTQRNSHLRASVMLLVRSSIGSSETSPLKVLAMLLKKFLVELVVPLVAWARPLLVSGMTPSTRLSQGLLVKLLTFCSPFGSHWQRHWHGLGWNRYSHFDCLGSH
jgi:hypothetical protein